ncbi:MAG TPA: ChaN family lipoprotein [Geobacteraceae bacterium]
MGRIKGAISRRADTRGVFLAVVMAVTLCLAGCAGLPVATDDGKEMEKILSATQGADVLFVGEVHDRRSHHQLQLDIIKALHGRKVPLAIGLEMFDVESQETLDLWRRGKLELSNFIDRYRQSWTIDWTSYDEMLLYARNNAIPLIALNVPDDIITRIAHDGIGSLRPKDLSRLPAGVNATMGDSYRGFLREAFASHGMREEAFAAFCDAQGVRNSTMALRIASWLSREPGTTMVVITGVGHAMRRAVPTVLAGISKLRTKVIIPVTNDSLPGGVEERDADLFVVP